MFQLRGREIKNLNENLKRIIGIVQSIKKIRPAGLQWTLIKFFCQMNIFR